MNDARYLVGPFTQLLTMDHLPAVGPINDEALEILEDGAIAFHGCKIAEIGSFKKLAPAYARKHIIDFPAVALPGWIDSHTHLCFAGCRAADYALRLQGKSYLDIARTGGGILETVRKTRAASHKELLELTLQRAKRQLRHGITTCEVKSGYGLSIEDEIKMLEVIAEASKLQPVDLIPTCLAAHALPPEFSNPAAYLETLAADLFPKLIERNLSRRIDIFVEQGAFEAEAAKKYLQQAKLAGFTLCVHADQFSRGGAQLAAEVGALSADHLEMSGLEDFTSLLAAGTIPILLPGSSIGLGHAFAPARAMLDMGLPVVLASDWNPGSAPMGHLIAEAAIMGANQKLTTAETFAALTTRAAKALGLRCRGVLKNGMRGDLVIYPCHDYRAILYYQGSLNPRIVIAGGQLLETCA